MCAIQLMIVLVPPGIVMVVKILPITLVLVHTALLQWDLQAAISGKYVTE